MLKSSISLNVITSHTYIHNMIFINLVLRSRMNQKHWLSPQLKLSHVRDETDLKLLSTQTEISWVDINESPLVSMRRRRTANRCLASCADNLEYSSFRSCEPTHHVTEVSWQPLCILSCKLLQWELKPSYLNLVLKCQVKKEYFRNWHQFIRNCHYLCSSIRP